MTGSVRKLQIPHACRRGLPSLCATQHVAREPNTPQGKRGGFSLRSCLAAALFLTLGPALLAADIHSNGRGGGPWSEAGTWRGNAVPTADDIVTIAGEDTVIVDLKDEQKTSCKELYIDPRGVLSFKRGAGKVTLTVTGPVESYGLIRLDMKDSTDDAGELRLVGTTSEQRSIRLQRGGSLILHGRPGLPEGGKNVTISCQPTIVDTNSPSPDPTCRLEATDHTSLEISHALLSNVVLYAVGLDNTGATPNERVNIVGSRFTGQARIQLEQCDTPLVADNEVISEKPQHNVSGIRFGGGALGTIRGNQVFGPFTIGICFDGHVDGSAIGNTVTGAQSGFYYQGPNAMMQQNTARDCEKAVRLHGMSGVIADFTAENCPLGVEGSTGVLQLNNFQLARAPTNAVALSLNRMHATLVNCRIAPDQIKLGEEPRKERPDSTIWWAEAKQYVIVRVQGQVPASSQVAIVTANPEKPIPPGALDPNVHNSPALIGPGGWTPFPQALNPLIVRTWRIEAEGKVVPPPQYKLRVLGPAPNPDTPQPVLKEVDVTPQDDWYRPQPNEQKATVEVTVP
jgi:hypothetical protein